MPRIRNVKPELFRHEDLQEVEAGHPGQYVMLAYIGIWTQCDKNGVFPYKPKQLHLDVLPFLDFDMAETLRILESAGYVERFEHEGKEYGVIPTFKKHQAISAHERDGGFQYPTPPTTPPGTASTPAQADTGTAKTHTEHLQDTAKTYTEPAPSRPDFSTSLRHDVIDDSMKAYVAPDEPSPSLAPPEEEKPSPKKPRTAKFTPPTLEEVTAYCQERRNGLDPGRWLAYYEANGWRVGRNPMRDWQAAVRTWEGNGYDRPPGKPAVPAKQETEEQRALREKARRLFGPKALREPVGGVP